MQVIVTSMKKYGNIMKNLKKDTPIKGNLQLLRRVKHLNKSMGDKSPANQLSKPRKNREI